MSDGPTNTLDNNRQRLQLWFEQFRDLAFIQLALAGGVITLMGTVFTDAQYRGRGLTSVTLLALAATSALVGQSHVVDLSDKGQGPDRTLTVTRAICLVLFGSGAGAFAMFTLRSLGLR